MLYVEGTCTPHRPSEEGTIVAPDLVWSPSTRLKRPRLSSGFLQTGPSTSQCEESVSSTRVSVPLFAGAEVGTGNEMEGLGDGMKFAGRKIYLRRLLGPHESVLGAGRSNVILLSGTAGPETTMLSS